MSVNHDQKDVWKARFSFVFLFLPYGMTYFELKIPSDADRVDETFIPLLALAVIPFQVIAQWV